MEAYVGAHHLRRKLKALGHASDTFVLDKTNCVAKTGTTTITSITLAAVGDFVRLKAMAAGWQIQDFSGSVVVEA